MHTGLFVGDRVTPCSVYGYWCRRPCPEVRIQPPSSCGSIMELANPLMSEQVRASVVRFGVYELNLRSGELRKHGLKIRLRGQQLKILTLLLERPGDVISREEIKARLWPADTFVDFEHSLNSAVKKLRNALSDSAESPRYIETVPTVGYRFIAPVDASQPDVAAASLAAPEALLEASADSDAPGVHWRKRTVLAWVALVIVVISAWFAVARWRVSTRTPAPAGKVMLAVLPFMNLTGDPEQEYFSDGLTEEMITQLASIDPQRLGLVARTSVMHYKNTQEKLDQIGQELGVQYLLEGSVRRDSEKVRISAQLIQVKGQTQLWAREYDRELSNLLTLQSEIAQEIGDEIRSEIRGGTAGRSAAARKLATQTTSYEAYDLYLKGRYFWNKRNAAGFEQAAEYFQQAIARDPNYARAYAGLADTYALMASWFIAPQGEIIPKAREAALRALQLDDSLAEAHCSLALIAQNHDYDWQTAEKEYRRAIELDPDYATAHQWYAEFLSIQGRFDEALAESERARRLDPLSLIISTDHGAILYFARQYDRAIEQFRSVFEMDPAFPRAHLIICAYVEEGRFEDAMADIENWRRNDNGTTRWAEQAYVYGRWGRRAEAKAAMAHFQELLRSHHPVAEPKPQLLRAYVALGMKDQAIALLEKSYAEHSNAVISMKVEPTYDPLRSDPRFQALLRRLGLDR
jgi:TolB-like protein/DNA-binding winged helix-turn-helix (wHTH) protein/Tfp pilus assembly protein PilF